MPAARERARREDFARALERARCDINLTGAFLSVQPALAGMRARDWGRIVFIASTAGLKGYAYVAPYVAAKHGVVGLTRALALETAKDGITVKRRLPRLYRDAAARPGCARIVANDQTQRSRARAALAADNPQGRLIQPQEVADVVLWLCADESASITGQAITVPGGETW